LLKVTLSLPDTVRLSVCPSGIVLEHSEQNVQPEEHEHRDQGIQRVLKSVSSCAHFQQIDIGWRHMDDVDQHFEYEILQLVRFPQGG
jgi:hypothetical protein